MSIKSEVICPKCHSSIVKDSSSESLCYCSVCLNNFSVININGFEIIDFISNDQDFTVGFSASFPKSFSDAELKIPLMLPKNVVPIGFIRWSLSE